MLSVLLLLPSRPLHRLGLVHDVPIPSVQVPSQLFQSVREGARLASGALAAVPELAVRHLVILRIMLDLLPTFRAGNDRRIVREVAIIPVLAAPRFPHVVLAGDRRRPVAGGAQTCDVPSFCRLLLVVDA